jgi:hypothetical protein
MHGFDGVAASTRQAQPDWDRIILIFSNGVTVGLIALYVFGKATSRW